MFHALSKPKTNDIVLCLKDFVSSMVRHFSASYDKGGLSFVSADHSDIHRDYQPGDSAKISLLATSQKQAHAMGRELKAMGLDVEIYSVENNPPTYHLLVDVSAGIDRPSLLLDWTKNLSKGVSRRQFLTNVAVGTAGLSGAALYLNGTYTAGQINDAVVEGRFRNEDMPKMTDACRQQVAGAGLVSASIAKFVTDWVRSDDTSFYAIQENLRRQLAGLAREKQLPERF